jgi:MFS family permease
VQVVLATILVTMMGFGIVAPILPLFAQSFGVGYDDVGVLVASFALTRLAFDLVAGPLVDRYGERSILTFGMAILAGTTGGGTRMCGTASADESSRSAWVAPTASGIIRRSAPAPRRRRRRRWCARVGHQKSQ